MKIDLTDLSPVKKTMVVEVEAEEVEKETEKVLLRYRRQARIPGFRPGKAPLSIIRNRFAKEVEQDVRERVVSRSYSEATREKGLTPLGDPLLEEIDFSAGQALRFKTTFEVLPAIEPKKYKDVTVRRPAAALAEGDVDRALEELRQSRARLVTEEGRAASVGDFVVADAEASPEGGEPFQRERMIIEVGGAENLPPFNEALAGATAGSERELTVSYPAEHQAKELAGRTVAYRLRVHEIKRRVVPPLDDEFAKDLGDFEDLPALRARLEQDLALRKAREAEQALRQAVLDKVMLENPIVLPESLVETEVRRRLEEIVRSMMRQGLEPERMEIDWEQLRKRQEDSARRSVHARLILDAVARAESLAVSTAEIDERIRRDAQSIGETFEKLRSQLRKHAGLQAVEHQLLREKALDYLTAVANIQDVE